MERQTHVMVWLAGDRKGKPQEPAPVRRPGVGIRKKPALSAEGRAYLQYLRDNQGALPPGYALMRAN